MYIYLNITKQCDTTEPKHLIYITYIIHLHSTDVHIHNINVHCYAKKTLDKPCRVC